MKLKKSLIVNDSLKVSIKVTNIGKTAGQEAVELYTRDMVASITPCVKRLRRFDKINLKPGESKIVNFVITKEDLAFVNQDLYAVTEPGAFEIIIAGQKTRIYYK